MEFISGFLNPIVSLLSVMCVKSTENLCSSWSTVTPVWQVK